MLIKYDEINKDTRATLTNYLRTTKMGDIAGYLRDTRSLIATTVTE